MIFGIGIDIIEVARIKEAILTYGLQFTDRIFAEHEKAYCSDRLRQYEHFTARFAAKEAFAKALGTGVRRGFRWKEVTVRNSMSGKPQIELFGSMITRVSTIVGTEYRAELSITHTAETAEAIAIIETI